MATILDNPSQVLEVIIPINEDLPGNQADVVVLLSQDMTSATPHSLIDVTIPERVSQVKFAESEVFRKYRPNDQRVFCNRPVEFSSIKGVGFDMDYTIAPYNDDYVELQYSLSMKNLVNKFSYPAEILQIKYDPIFGQKGLFLDILLGNILKVDQHGFVHIGFHGKKRLDKDRIKSYYKDSMIPIDELEKSNRYFLMSQMFAAPTITMFAELIDFFENQQSLRDPLVQNVETTLAYDEHSYKHMQQNQVCYEMIYQDVNKAIGMIHGPKDDLKQMTQKDPSKYVIKPPHIAQLFTSLRLASKKTFLVTNSGYEYTDVILRYLFGENFTDFFDYIIVDSNKPAFFTGSAPFRKVIDDKKLLINIGQKFEKGQIYAGGNLKDFLKMTGLRQKDILFCGDHILGDAGIARSEQQRTLYVVPDIKHELAVMQQNKDLYRELRELEMQRSTLMSELCLQKVSTPPPQLQAMSDKIALLSEMIDMKFNKYFGSNFSTSWGATWLAAYMTENCDLYACDVANLYNYPPFYLFNASGWGRLLPHQDIIINVIEKNQQEQDSDLTVSKVISIDQFKEFMNENETNLVD